MTLVGKSVHDASEQSDEFLVRRGRNACVSNLPPAQGFLVSLERFSQRLLFRHAGTLAGVIR